METNRVSTPPVNFIYDVLLKRGELLRPQCLHRCGEETPPCLLGHWLASRSLVADSQVAGGILFIKYGKVFQKELFNLF